MRFKVLTRSSGNSDELPRHAERNRRAARTSVTSIGAKALTALVSLLSVPLTLPYLGKERFGLWITLASFQTVFTLADFGVGNGVLQLVSDAYGRNDHRKIRQTVLSGLKFQAVVALSLVALFLISYRLIPWAGILHVHGTKAQTELRPALVYFFVIFAVRSVTQVIQQAQYAVQAGYIANIWSGIGNLLALIGLVISSVYHAGVPTLCLVVSGLPVCSSLANSCTWLMNSRQFRETVASECDKWFYGLRELISIGFLFFALQLVAQLHAGIDPLIVNELLGPTAVAQFIVVQRPFDLFLIFLLLALQPLWPAYREAVVVGDVIWIRKTFQRTIIMSMSIAACFSLTMTLGGKTIISWWTQHQEIPSGALLDAYSLSLLFSATQPPIAFLLNGLGSVRTQLMIALPGIAVSLILKIMLLPRFGLSLIPISTIAAGMLLLLPAQLFYIKKLLGDVHPNATSKIA
jgi:O-antigen/teichoic acid export membrane protein